MAFSVLAALYFLDLLNVEKEILVGHSAPERVAALILVAPAIFAPINTSKTVKENQSKQDNQIREEDNSSSKSPVVGLYKMLSKITKYIADVVMKMLRGMAYMLNSLYKKFLSSILCSSLAVMVVRMTIDKFGTAAVRNAWYDPNQVSEYILSGYKKPLRTKDWDRALVEYTVAMLLDEESKKKANNFSKTTRNIMSR